jgi:hypothetical protein
MNRRRRRLHDHEALTMGTKRNVTKTPVTPAELRRYMIMAWEELTKNTPNDPPAKPQIALLMSQWGAEQSGGTTYNFNLTGIKHPGKKLDHYDTDFFFAATLEVFDKEKAEGYKQRGGDLVEVVKDEGATMTLRFKPDHPACAFRSFNSLAEGCLFHLRNLRDTYKSAWTALTTFTDEKNTGPVTSFVGALAGLRYFTGSKATYQANVMKFYNEYSQAAGPVWDEAFQYAEARRH